MVSLNAHDLTCLRGSHLVFEGLSFGLDAGGALLLTGPNGSGKSSLIRALAGLIGPLDGRVTVDGGDIRSDREAHRARIAYLGHQDPIKPTLRVRETVAFAAALDGTPSESRIARALDALDLTALADTHGAVLSSGQRRRASLTRFLVSDAPIWLMDEPTVGLDTASVALVAAVVARHRNRGGIAVLSTHTEFPLPDAQTLDLGDFSPVILRDEVPA